MDILNLHNSYDFFFTSSFQDKERFVSVFVFGICHNSQQADDALPFFQSRLGDRAANLRSALPIFGV
jgi:hypothetical protein